MKRKLILALVAFAAAAVYLSLSGLPGYMALRSAPELGTIIGGGDEDAYRFYPASAGAERGAQSRQRRLPNGVEMTYILNPDGSSEDITASPTSGGPTQRLVYFPRSDSASGRDGRRLHIIQNFAGPADKRYVSEEKILREDGSREEYTETAADGARHLRGYGRDGNTVLHDLVTFVRYTWDPPVVQHEERWREEDHTLSYSDIMDEKDKSHTQTEWDQAHHPTKVTLIPENGFGITIRSFYPGTDRVRMEAKQDSSYTEARYFRLDGTLHHLLRRSRGMFEVEYMDELGLLNLRQRFYVDTVDHNPETKHGFILKLYSVEEIDSTGEVMREFSFRDDRVYRVELLHADFLGRHYYAVTYVMEDDGSVKKVFLWNTEQGHRADSEIEGPGDGTEQNQKLVAPAPPLDKLKPLVNLEEDELPVPPPQYEH